MKEWILRSQIDNSKTFKCKNKRKQNWEFFLFSNTKSIYNFFKFQLYKKYHNNSTSDNHKSSKRKRRMNKILIDYNFLIFFKTSLKISPYLNNLPTNHHCPLRGRLKQLYKIREKNKFQKKLFWTILLRRNCVIVNKKNVDIF